jgi:hypothetical protein
MTTKKKQKYYERDMFSINNESNLINKDRNTNGKSNFIEHENNLIMPSDSSNSCKNLFEYEDLNQQSYNTPLKISEINIRKQFTNYHGHHTGPGKGFGNLSISNNIRQGSSTRLDNTEIKIKKETQINERFDLIDKNFQNPHNLILPFARGGEITRKSLKEESQEEDTSDQINKYRFNY